MKGNRMKAIETIWLAPTQTRPTRIKATCERGSIIVDYDDLDAPDNEGKHKLARQKLIDKFIAEDAPRYGNEKNPWSKKMVFGQLANGNYVHVFVGGDK